MGLKKLTNINQRNSFIDLSQATCILRQTSEEPYHTESWFAKAWVLIRNKRK